VLLAVRLGIPSKIEQDKVIVLEAAIAPCSGVNLCGAWKQKKMWAAVGASMVVACGPVPPPKQVFVE